MFKKTEDLTNAQRLNREVLIADFVRTIKVAFGCTAVLAVVYIASFKGVADAMRLARIELTVEEVKELESRIS